MGLMSYPSSDRPPFTAFILVSETTCFDKNNVHFMRPRLAFAAMSL